MQTVLLCCLALFAPTAALRAGFLPRWSSPVANSAAASRTPAAAMEATPEKLRFLTSEGTLKLREEFGTPFFVYDEATLKRQALKAMDFPHAFGLTVRFAMKALPNAAVLQLFDTLGLHIDASSGFEVRRAMAAGITADKISLSSQELSADLPDLLALGIKYNACSLRQLEAYGKACKGDRTDQLGVRFNPGLGSGGTGKTNVGGPASSFGIWHELMPQVQAIIKEYDLEPARVHTHIGSGSDPAVWQKVASLSLGLCEQIPSVSILNLGGGYKVGRMNGEPSTDLQTVGTPVKAAFEEYAKRTGKEMKLEVEPGTFLVANSGALVSTVQDLVTTGDAGFSFLKLDSGMTELLRPSLYGAQHPLILVHGEAKDRKPVSAKDHSFIAVGHCCESGDLVTPAPDEPEVLLPRALGADAAAGDLIVVEGAGAYCSSMSTKHYNSFPECAEVMLDADGKGHLIRRKQEVTEIWSNEVKYASK